MALSSRFRWIVLLAALAVLVGLGGWWRSHGGTEPNASGASDRQERAESASAGAARSSSTFGVRRPRGNASHGSRRPIRPLEGQASSDDERAAGSLSGVVRSTRTREPVAGAELLFEHLGTLHALTTSASGAFSFRPATEGEYLLTRIAADGYLPFAPELGHSPISFIARRGQAIRAVTLWLDEAGADVGAENERPGVPEATDDSLSEVRIAGQVTDADSKRPVPAFVVLVSEPRLERPHAGSTSVFDGDGRFEVDGLAAKTPYVVNVFAHGYATSVDVAVTTGTETDPPRELHIALERGAKLVGSVRAADDRSPIGGADVMLEGHLGEATSAVPIVVTAQTDPRGDFELLGAAPGLRSIRVSARGYHTRIVGPFEVPGSSGASVEPLLVELSRTAEGEESKVELVGIGAALRPDGESFVVEQVIADGGAARAGLRQGDRVLAIDGVDVTVLGFEGAVQRIRGAEGTQVLLRVHRDGAPADLAVERVRIRG